MLTYRLRFYTGPTIVKELGDKFRMAGIHVEHIGTEHLIVLARGNDRYDAAQTVWHKLHDRYATTFGLDEPKGEVVR
jgi:hypothetical protein